MNQMLPGLIMGFREGLEAFLLIFIIFKYIATTNQSDLKNKVIQGSIAGVILSLILGILLNAISNSIGGVETLTKLWESVASLIALALVTTFIFWMINSINSLAMFTSSIFSDDRNSGVRLHSVR